MVSCWYFEIIHDLHLRLLAVARLCNQRILRIALDIILLFADNNPQHQKAKTEESTSAEAARDVWSMG